MGSPSAPVLSNLVLEHLFDSIFSTLSYKTTYFKFYVDDCFCTIPLSGIQYLLFNINSFHPNIQFTYEFVDPISDELPFLDLKLIHTENFFRIIFLCIC
jgi:hypothetical protein